jgi:hypothetical protein
LVNVTNRVGFVQSQAATLTVVPPITAERVLPIFYSPGVALTVRLQTVVGTEGGEAYAYAVEDTPPSGWTVAKLSKGGVYDPVNQKVKFGPVFDLVSSSFSYEVTPPPGTVGVAVFRGLISTDGSENPIGGAASILPGPLHPADLNPGDHRITINEITAYAGAWRKGTGWSVSPSPIPIDYVTRAGLLWKNGELYRFDSTLPAPLWWVSDTNTMPGIVRLALSSITPPQPSTATRLLPALVIPGEPFTAAVAVQPAAPVSSYAVEEQPPSGAVVSLVSDAGVYDAAAGIVRWGPFFDSSPRTLSYQLMVQAASPTSLVFVGRASFDGVSDITGGSQSISTSVRLKQLTVLASGETSLSLGAADGQVYQIQSSTDLEHWVVLLTLTNSNSVLRFQDPNWGKAAQSFYRVVRQP